MRLLFGERLEDYKEKDAEITETPFTNFEHNASKIDDAVWVCNECKGKWSDTDSEWVACDQCNCVFHVSCTDLELGDTPISQIKFVCKYYCNGNDKEDE